MHLLMFDTCVWLELASKKSEVPILSLLKHLVTENIVQILVPDLVKKEFEKNKIRVANQTHKRLTQELKIAREILTSFGNEKKQDAIDVISDINHRLPLITDANYMTIERIEYLFEKSTHIESSEKSIMSAVQRAINKRAPFHQNKNSIADAILIELFDEFRLLNIEKYKSFRFVTINHQDFSDVDHRKPHNDFSEIFSDEGVHFFITPSAELSGISDSEIEFDDNDMWAEETRGLFEILEALDEFTDKIWYSRHRLLEESVNDGSIKLVPDSNDENESGVIQEGIWKGALEAAKTVEGKYSNLGPWDDFEWGELNGKLSALRWVLGEDWDSLYT